MRKELNEIELALAKLVEKAVAIKPATREEGLFLMKVANELQHILLEVQLAEYYLDPPIID